MEHDVKEGWCICGEYHKKVKAEKPAKKASRKKPPPPPAPPLPEEKPEERLKGKDDDDLMKYPFGAPRIF